MVMYTLRIDHGGGHDVDNVFDQRTPRKIIDRPMQTLQHRTNRDRPRRFAALPCKCCCRCLDWERSAPSALPATGESNVLVAGAAYWMGPSTANCESRIRTNFVAALTVSPSTPLPESPIE